MSDNINIVKNSLRWIAVLPISIAGSIVGCLILIALILFGDLLSGDLWLYMHHPEVFPISHFFTSFLVSAALGCIFVYLGTALAPAYKKAVAFTLFGCLAIVCGFLLIITLLSIGFAESWRFAANLTICIISSGVTAFNAGDDEFTLSA